MHGERAAEERGEARAGSKECSSSVQKKSCKRCLLFPFPSDAKSGSTGRNSLKVRRGPMFFVFRTQ
jgi:hypothetical protein